MAQNQKTVRGIEVVVKADSATRAIDNLNKKFNKMSKDVEKTSKSLASVDKLLSRLSGVAIGGFAFRELAEGIDQFSLLEDRIASIVGSGAEASSVFEKLADSAGFLKSSISSVAETYSRVALSISELGLSSNSIIAVTTALQQTFRLSGATIAEATGAVIQMSQGLSSGSLRGQELRSVLESNAILSGLLAEKFGVARGQLIKLAESGAITSKKVLEIMADNFESLNNKASKLGLTFSQLAIIVKDKFFYILTKAFKSIDGNGALNKALSFFNDNLLTTSNVLSALSAVAVPALIAGFSALASVIYSNPIGATIAVASFLLVKYVTDTEKSLLLIEKYWLKLELALVDTGKITKETTSEMTTAIINTGKVAVVLFDTIIKGYKELFSLISESVPKDDTAKLGESYQKALDRLSAIDSKLTDIEKKNSSKDKEDYLATLKREVSGLEETEKQLSVVDAKLSELNMSYLQGTVALSEYYQKLDDIKNKNISDDFKRGKIELDKYNAGLAKLNREVFTLDSTIVGINSGLASYVASVGTYAEGISKLTVSVFSQMEDKLIEFVRNGKVSFKDFADSVINDLLRIAIQQNITKNLASGLGSFFSTDYASAGGAVQNTSSTAYTMNAGYAKGGAFRNGIEMFASGGVVSSPTFFSHKNGQSAVMGEAGTEAILPLRRGSSGNLGVEASVGGNTVVNVINNSGSNVETSERTGSGGEKIIDVMIGSKIKDAISNGSLDRTMSARYGLKPRGI